MTTPAFPIVFADLPTGRNPMSDFDEAFADVLSGAYQQALPASAITGVLATANGGEANVATRTAMAALDTSTYTVAYLMEAGRRGWFQWSSASLSTQVTSDPLQGIYVPPASAPSGASGAWVRQLVNDTYTPEMFGAVADGVTDDSAAINALHNVLFAAGGGVVLFGYGPYLFSSRITLPNDGTQVTPYLPAKQPPIEWRGIGNDSDCPASDVNAVKSPRGSVILLGYQDASPGWVGVGARLQTLGRGMFRLRNLNLCAAATTAVGVVSTPLLLTTNTSLDIDNSVSFYGPSNRYGLTADCDAIILGGTSENLNNDNNSAFQGYATRITGGFFSKIRRLVSGRTYCNGVMISNLTAWTSCGNVDGGAIEFDGGPNTSVGNVVSDVLIEVPFYKHGVNCVAKVTRSSFINIKCYDPAATTVSAVNFTDSSSVGNVVISAFPGNGVLPPITVGSGPGRYFSIPADSAAVAKFPSLTMTGGNNKSVVQPDDEYGPNSTASLFQVKRNANESSDPGALLFEVIDRGGIKIKKPGGTGNPNNTMIDMEAAVLDLNGARWAYPGVGGNMAQNSGTGGSYFDLTNYGVRFFSQASAYLCRIGAGLAGMKWGTSSTSDDLGISRNAAGVLEVNSGTAGTLRDIMVRSVLAFPPASIAPTVNGELVVEATSNTSLTFKLKGSDGTVRTGAITLS